MIDAGDEVPSEPVRLIGAEGTTETTSDVALAGKRVVFFTVPGAFTPTCHVNHLPGFIANANKLKAAGVDRIVCGAANDHHVVKTWGEATQALGTIEFIADPHLKLARAMGLDKEFGDLGQRYRRSAMIIEDGVVRAVFIEDKPGVNATGAPAILMALEAAAV